MAYGSKLQKGFSLLEILVVFSLIALITGVGFVAFNTYSQKSVITSAADDVKLGIEKAKYNALSRVKPPGCTGELLAYQINFINSTQYRLTAVCTTQSMVYSTGTLPKGVTFRDQNSCDGIMFDTVTNSISIQGLRTLPCTFEVNAYSSTQSITVTTDGNVVLGVFEGGQTVQTGNVNNGDSQNLRFE